MKEASSAEIDLKEINGPVLETLLSMMYGDSIEDFDLDMLAALFLAADALQVTLCNTGTVSELLCI